MGVVCALSHSISIGFIVWSKHSQLIQWVGVKSRKSTRSLGGIGQLPLFILLALQTGTVSVDSIWLIDVGEPDTT